MAAFCRLCMSNVHCNSIDFGQLVAMIALPAVQSYTQTFITVRNKVAKVMFLHVSVCPRGEYLGRCPPRPGTPSWEAHPLGSTPHLGSTPPLEAHPPREMADAADGTHPTGMHSCSQCYFVH